MDKFELIYVIVNYGMGSKIVKKAKAFGLQGGTIFHGKGTINNSLLHFLSLYDERKEIVLMGTSEKTADQVLPELCAKFQFHKPNHGIVFTTSACNVVGSCHLKEEECLNLKGETNVKYQNIIVIVERGNASDVIDAAQSAGSQGGTIINARGSGMHETSKLFNMAIEPEREMVFILSREESTEAIVSAIREKLNIDLPGNGIIFVQDVKRVYGIYDK